MDDDAEVEGIGMNQYTKIFLDMDGILADFVKAACQLHNRPEPCIKPEHYGEFDLEKGWGITPEQFWAPIADQSLDFWVGLEKTPEADQLVNLAIYYVGVDNIAILTAPSKDSGSVPGKRLWIEKNYPQFKKQMIFTSAKGFLAGPDRILIDDRDRNIEEFAKAGGSGILLPRLWNSYYTVSNVALHAVATSLFSLSKLQEERNDKIYR